MHQIIFNLRQWVSSQVHCAFCLLVTEYSTVPPVVLHPLSKTHVKWIHECKTASFPMACLGKALLERHPSWRWAHTFSHILLPLQQVDPVHVFGWRPGLQNKPAGATDTCFTAFPSSEDSSVSTCLSWTGVFYKQVTALSQIAPQNSGKRCVNIRVYH